MECPACHGDGCARTKLRYGEDGEPCIIDDPCEECGGDGWIYDEDCDCDDCRRERENAAGDRLYHASVDD